MAGQPAPADWRGLPDLSQRKRAAGEGTGTRRPERWRQKRWHRILSRRRAERWQRSRGCRTAAEEVAT
ncbi:hypothetical protein LIER_43991 [Lithospermum erythrorhizon]|uniref:Uncharacterized protein n=1 Tax=Lithospermum erythrorhizon TaxID=34254 RepID=A0AAV3RIU8_LITER